MLLSLRNQTSISKQTRERRLGTGALFLAHFLRETQGKSKRSELRPWVVATHRYFLLTNSLIIPTLPCHLPSAYLEASVSWPAFHLPPPKSHSLNHLSKANPLFQLVSENSYGFCISWSSWSFYLADSSCRLQKDGWARSCNCVKKNSIELDFGWLSRSEMRGEYKNISWAAQIQKQNCDPPYAATTNLRSTVTSPGSQTCRRSDHQVQPPIQETKQQLLQQLARIATIWLITDVSLNFCPPSNLGPTTKSQTCNPNQSHRLPCF